MKIYIMCGRGPGSATEKALTDENGILDPNVIFVYSPERWPDWKPANGLPHHYNDTASIRNHIVKDALDTDKQFYILEDDIAYFFRYTGVKESKTPGGTPVWEKVYRLPALDCSYGGLHPPQFSRHLWKIKCECTHTAPYIVMWFDLEKLGFISFKPGTYDDFDIYLELKKRGHLSNIYLHTLFYPAGSTMNDLLGGNSVEESGKTTEEAVKKFQKKAYETYKLWGEDNCKIEVQHGVINLRPGQGRSIKPVRYIYDMTSYETFVNSVIMYNTANGKNVPEQGFEGLIHGN